MFPTARCPGCGGVEVRLSLKGWVRRLARLALVRPLRCESCYRRFWRLVVVPPSREAAR